MFSDIDLRALAEASGPERAFLSVYLSGPEALAGLSPRVRRIRALLADDAAEAEHFEENLTLVERAVEQWRFDEAAVAIFACWANDYLKAFPLEKAPRDLIWVDSSPYIRPIAELQDEYENFALVVADNERARLYFVTSATADEQRRVRGDVKNHVKVGGWSQKRYERRRDKQLQHYGQDVARALKELDERETFDRIVLVGSKEALEHIREALPPPFAERVADARRADLDDEDAVMDEAYTAFFEEERADEAALWRRITDEYLRGGRAAMGPADVLKAAAVGQAERLLVARDARLEGVRCRSCENLSPGTPATCPVCGETDVFSVDLVNELVELAALSSAETEFSDPTSALVEAGQVAALLRY